MAGDTKQQPANVLNITKVNKWINGAAGQVQNVIGSGDTNGLRKWLQTASKIIGMEELLAGLVVVKLEDVPGDTLSYVRANPGNMAYCILNGMLIISPGVLLGPAFAALGFTSTGVRAASLAARWQSTMGGYVAKKGVFATFTSAAMGGYGAAVVNGVVRGGSALGGIANKYFRPETKTRGPEHGTDTGGSATESNSDVALNLIKND